MTSKRLTSSNGEAERRPGKPPTDTSPATGDEATAAWEQYGLPLYGNGDAQADMKQRRARALRNDDVLTHFRSGACGPADPSGDLPAITCPTLILAGQDDPVVPAAAARRLAMSLPHAPVTLEVMAGVGHGTFRQATQQAFTHVRHFVTHTIPALADSSHGSHAERHNPNS